MRTYWDWYYTEIIMIIGELRPYNLDTDNTGMRLRTLAES